MTSHYSVRIDRFLISGRACLAAYFVALALNFPAVAADADKPDAPPRREAKKDKKNKTVFRGPAIAPTLENVAYGPHARNVMDLWLAKSDAPTPLVVFIHGGGFINGDKSIIRSRGVIQKCLDRGASFASINYRFRDTAPIQDILRDAARAIQYVRSRAKEWNIDPTRIAAFGSSAGAGTSLWLAVHDDLADPSAKDPVLRQSSRLAAAGLLDGQASYDLRDWEKIVGPAPYQRSEQDRLSFHGFKSVEEMNSAEGDRVMKDCAMLQMISKDDPPIVAACTRPDGESVDRGHYVHHPRHATAIAERCKQHGVDSLVLLIDSTPRDQQQVKVVDFLLKKLGK